MDALHDEDTNGRLVGWYRVSSLAISSTIPVACALLVVAVLAGGWNYVAGQDSQADAKRQRSFIVRSDHLVSAMKDLEIGERGTS